MRCKSVTTKDYNIRTYAGGPDCNHITYRIKNIEGLHLLVWCKDPMFSYTAEDAYPWHATSLRTCVIGILHADIYDEEHEALKKYDIKNTYSIRGTEYDVIEVVCCDGIATTIPCSKTEALRVKVTPSCTNDALSISLKIKPFMIENHIKRKYRV